MGQNNNIRSEIDPLKLQYLDSIAQIVAKLYLDKEHRASLGEEVSELQEAVYALGQAYMLLYGELLDRSVEEEDSTDELSS